MNKSLIESMKNENQTKVSIDLFSGPGGLCTGFRWAGIKALIAVEWSYWTVQTYAASHNADIFELEKYLDGTMENPDLYFKENTKTLLIYGDINKVEINLINKILKERFGVDSVDIVTGGAPCESFSMAGDRKQDDERNSLYQNVLRIARGVDSKMFLFENVKGLFSKKKDDVAGAMYKYICEEFQSEIEGKPSFKLASTDKDTVLLKAIDYGVPQARERLFLVGVNRKYDAEYHYPKKTHGPGCKYDYVTVGDALLDLPQIEKSEETDVYDFDISKVEDVKKKEFLELMHGISSKAPYGIEYTMNSIFNHKAPGHTTKMFERIKSIKQGENMKKAYERLVEEGREEFAKENFPKKLYAARNRRLVLNEPSFTVTSHCLDEMIHPILDRALTPREAARLQSFPDWYQFKGPYVKFHSDPEQDQYEQIGDAIPPLLGLALGKEVIKTLNCIEGE
jgi:DNA (cytosine-5)-methyltransferase 1